MDTWRTLGDTTLATYRTEFSRFGSPLLADAAAIHAAVRPHSALALAVMFHEKKYDTVTGTIPASFRNPLAVGKPDGGIGLNRWEQYGSYPEAVTAWRERITSLTYKNGVYARTRTLPEWIHVYAPAEDDNDEVVYLAVLRERLAAFPRTQAAPSGNRTFNMTPGLVPLPGFDDESGTFDKREGVGMNRLGPRSIDVLFFHRALGYGARGVADWLKRSDVEALTDWVIDPETAYMIRLVEIQGSNADMSGWAQGPYRAPTPDLQRLTAKHGGSFDTINRHGESIEVAGMYGDPISAACKRDLAQWTASRAHDRGIRWDRFPLTPDGYSFIHAHFEACGIDLKPCCGSVVWAFINDGELIEMVRDILRTAQTGGMPPHPSENVRASSEAPAHFARPVPISGLLDVDRDDEDGLAAFVTVEGTTFIAVRDQVVAIRDTPRYQRANPDGPRIGPDIKAGEDFNAAWIFAADDGELWYLTPFWTRVRVRDTKLISDGGNRA